MQKEKGKVKIEAKEQKEATIVETGGLEKDNPHRMPLRAMPVTARDISQTNAHPSNKVAGKMLGKTRMIPGREEDIKE